MKAYAIVLNDNKISQYGYKKLKESNEKFNEFDLNVFEAVTSNKVNSLLKEYNINWNYPKMGTEIDTNLNLKKTAYTNADFNKRIACALSHYILWDKCLSENTPMLILEHDSIFINTVTDKILETEFDILGINDPRNATRKSILFHKITQESKDEYMPTPVIDDMMTPQGLAGNSAYIIKPEGAKRLLELVEEYGLWPNDAIMCRQLIPKLGITKTYYTKVQGLESTTTL
jgi:GR25 family glycosyltransferase involved in LPS biosynthesis